MKWRTFCLGSRPPFFSDPLSRSVVIAPSLLPLSLAHLLLFRSAFLFIKSTLLRWSWQFVRYSSLFDLRPAPTRSEDAIHLASNLELLQHSFIVVLGGNEVHVCGQSWVFAALSAGMLHVLIWFCKADHIPQTLRLSFSTRDFMHSGVILNPILCTFDETSFPSSSQVRACRAAPGWGCCPCPWPRTWPAPAR